MKIPIEYKFEIELFSDLALSSKGSLCFGYVVWTIPLIVDNKLITNIVCSNIVKYIKIDHKLLVLNEYNSTSVTACTEAARVEYSEQILDSPKWQPRLKYEK